MSSARERSGGTSGIDAFSRLARYEAHIQRSMFKALEELQRLQLARIQAGLDCASELPEPEPDAPLFSESDLAPVQP